MYLSAAEARERLRVSRDTLSKLIKSGDLKAFKIGSARNSDWRISEDDLDDYVRRQSSRAPRDEVPA